MVITGIRKVLDLQREFNTDIEFTQHINTDKSN